MRCFILLFCTATNIAFGIDATTAKQALDSGDYKTAITQYQTLIDKASTKEKSALEVQLAHSYLKDQNHEMAFKTFLNALTHTPHIETPPMSANEARIYEDALKLYLDHSAASAISTSNKLRQDYASAMVLHPDYYMVNYLLASAYANLGSFDDFFDRFYLSYQHYPDAFIAYKTRAILHIKLLERSRTEKERDVQRQEILNNAYKALERHPSDTSLYKLIITYSSEPAKGDRVVKFLNNIIENNFPIPRGDIPFYIQEALQYGGIPLAQKLLDKAREWYPSSHLLDSAQERINHQRKSEEPA